MTKGKEQLEQSVHRQGFENWISSPPYELSLDRHLNDINVSAWPGQYIEYKVQLAWEAWCQALQLDSRFDKL